MSARHWCYTLNNPGAFRPLYTDDVSYAVYQVERGANGTIHLQGYIQFKKRLRLSALKRLPGLDGAHWEVMRGSATQARAYCMKADTRVEGPYEHGLFEVGQGARNDLNTVAEAIVGGTPLQQVVSENPAMYVRYAHGLTALSFRVGTAKAKAFRSLTVLALTGEAGTGKTRAAYDVYGAQSVYKLGCNSNGTLWFDGYEGEPVLLIDDFTGWIRFTELLNVLDGYPYRCQVKGSSVWALWTVVIITSNVSIEKWYDLPPDRLEAMYRRITWWSEFPQEHDEMIEIMRRSAP